MSNHLRRTVPFLSVKLSLSDVVLIYRRVQLQLAEQAEFEIVHLAKPANQTDAQFEEFKGRARADAFKITTSIVGRDGQTLFGSDESVFESPNRPDPVNTIYMTNATAYTSFSGRRPICVFELTLDFSKPPLMDFSVPVSAPTPNGSALSVEGDRDAWVAAVTESVLSVVNARRTRWGWLHRGAVYDLGVLLLGLPFSLYLCWKLSGWIQSHLGSINQFLAGACYVYVLFLALNVYRVLFGYTKWAFPVVELSDNNDSSITHRAIWGAIVLALVGNAVWDLRALF